METHYWNPVTNQGFKGLKLDKSQHYHPVHYFKTAHTYTHISNTSDPCTYTQTDNADNSFPLSLSLWPGVVKHSVPAPEVKAKVNTLPSKTSHFPSHLLTTGQGPKTHRHLPSTPLLTLLSFSLFFYSSCKLHVSAMKLKSLPMSKINRLGEIWWLFSSLKLIMTLKCRVRLQFLIVRWFYVPCVMLFGGHIS